MDELARSLLPPERFTELFERGRLMPPDEALRPADSIS